MRFRILNTIFITVLFIVGCTKDDPAKPKAGAGTTYNDRTLKKHVLFNLSSAYNEKNANRVIELLDPDDYVFFFDVGDVGGPDNIPPSWPFSDEERATKNLMAGVQSIDLDLVDFQNAVWEEFTPGSFPTEVWYTATVRYELTIQVNADDSFITVGQPQAQFTVRQKPDGKFYLVEWRDMAGSSQIRGFEQSSWGKIKSQYTG